MLVTAVQKKRLVGCSVDSLPAEGTYIHTYYYLKVGMYVYLLRMYVCMCDASSSYRKPESL